MHKNIITDDEMKLRKLMQLVHGMDMRKVDEGYRLIKLLFTQPEREVGHMHRHLTVANATGFVVKLYQSFFAHLLLHKRHIENGGGSSGVDEDGKILFENFNGSEDMAAVVALNKTYIQRIAHKKQMLPVCYRQHLQM